jgi:hypothetical protein
MFPEFATTYKDENGFIHLYVFPGIDDDGKQIYRNMDLKNINIEYKYTKNNDKSYDFIFLEPLKRLTCTMIHSKTGDIKKFSFDIK